MSYWGGGVESQSESLLTIHRETNKVRWEYKQKTVGKNLPKL